MKVLYERERERGGANRIFCGGSWNRYADYARAAFRGFVVPGNRFINLGFRPLIRIRRLG